MLSPSARTASLAVASLLLFACGDDVENPVQSDAESPGQAPWTLRDVTAERGLAIDLSRTPAGRAFMPDSMTGGCALVDVDGDGDLDVFVAHGRWSEPDGPASDGLGRLWLQDEHGQFTDVSVSAGVVGPHYGMGVATGDVDNDGDVDIYVSCYGPDRLLRNRGDGTFEDASEDVSCVRTAQWGASCTFTDLNADGWLDIVVANYVDYPPDFGGAGEGAQLEYPAPGNFDGVPDAFLINRGDGTFHDRSAALGIDSASRGLGVAAGDWNGDGLTDVYVANDGQANHCWIQTEDGRFKEGALSLGLALSGDGRAEAGMGVARGDVNGDGLEDLMLTHLVQETHTLYLAKRRGNVASFSDRTLRAGIAAASVDMTGFGAALADLDLDGELDFIAVHGRVLRGPAAKDATEPPHWRHYAERDLVMLGEGERFRVVDAGDFDDRAETSRGLALGDVDGDGDLDVLVTTAAGRVHLFEASGAPRGAWIAVRALQPASGALQPAPGALQPAPDALPSSRDALGAEIRLNAGGVTRLRVLQTTHGYLSASEPLARFGLGAATAVESVTVRWPDGQVETFDGGPVNRVQVVRRGEGH